MPLPKMIDDSRFEARRQESDEVIQLNSWALDWWQKQLESSAEGRIARLSRRARTHRRTQKTFRLGYAPDSWDALSLYLRQKGATQQQIDRSGLVVKRRRRIVRSLPWSFDVSVFDHQGRPIAFGGRTLKNEDAKYINSPETAAM